jgi:hypothetical protein
MRRVVFGLLAGVLVMGMANLATAAPWYGHHHGCYGGGYCGPRPYVAAAPVIGLGGSGFGIGISSNGISAYYGGGYPSGYGYPGAYPGAAYGVPTAYAAPAYSAPYGGAAYGGSPYGYGAVMTSPRTFGYATPY